MRETAGLMKRIVGQIAMEQMGAMEWVDRNGNYVATGNVARERWIPTESVAQTIAQLFMAATSGEDPNTRRRSCPRLVLPARAGRRARPTSPASA